MPKEVQMSTYKQDRYDIPDYAVELLQNFKDQNQPMWKTLTVCVYLNWH
jgi:hypothetical protein